jgi:hypothetical protein
MPAPKDGGGPDRYGKRGEHVTKTAEAGAWPAKFGSVSQALVVDSMGEPRGGVIGDMLASRPAARRGAGLANEVAGLGQQREGLELYLAGRLRAGEPLDSAYPPEKLHRAGYEAWRSGGGRTRP